MAEAFDWGRLTDEDFKMAMQFTGGGRLPDLVIAPDGNPYLYRWHVTPPKLPANVYFHIQVSHDPERPLHDHPWDNQSVILSGSYHEVMCMCGERPTMRNTIEFTRKPGDVIWRRANWSHRLFLPDGIPYTMTLFSTGPKAREWGFWYPKKWVPYTDVTRVIGGKSVHVKPETTNGRS